MKMPLRGGILGAGLGSRLQSRAKTKPLALLNGETLLSHLTRNLRAAGIDQLHCALREELLSDQDKNELPQSPNLHYVFVNTESSLHTLVALIREMKGETKPALFTMADTILRRSDLRAFVNFCAELKDHECAVLVTTFVDDEKPLWTHLTENGDVKSFSSEPAHHITSGMYFLTPQAMNIAEELVAAGTHKMRNFLSALADKAIPIKTFVVSKTIDVDHPSDLDKAADFLHSD